LQDQQQQHCEQQANLAAGQPLQRQRQPAQLPIDLLAGVLRLLPLQQRIGSCSLVCRSWRAAAALATPELAAINTQETADALCAWLSGHGSSGVRHLNVQSNNHQERLEFSMPWQQLGQLQSLRLKMVALPGPAEAAHVPPFAVLTALTSLRLSCYNMLSFAFAWQLRLLTGLRSLKLFPLGNENDAAGFRDALARVLPQLMQLTSLCLRQTGLDGAA
jgi:hypothetical protein